MGFVLVRHALLRCRVWLSRFQSRSAHRSAELLSRISVQRDRGGSGRIAPPRIPPVERRDRARTGPTITDEHPRRNNRCARHGGRLVAGLGRPTQAIGHASAIGQSVARSFASRTRLCCGRYSSNVTLPRVGFDAQLRACMVSERPDIPPRAISTSYLPFGRRERSDVSVRASALPRRRPNIPHLR